MILSCIMFRICQLISWKVILIHQQIKRQISSIICQYFIALSLSGCVILFTLGGAFIKEVNEVKESLHKVIQTHYTCTVIVTWKCFMGETPLDCRTLISLIPSAFRVISSTLDHFMHYFWRQKRTLQMPKRDRRLLWKGTCVCNHPISSVAEEATNTDPANWCSTLMHWDLTLFSK